VHAEGFRPMLFDLENEPNELHDIGGHRADLAASIRESSLARIQARVRAFTNGTAARPAGRVAEHHR
jgi:hypothetical protein